MADRNVLSGQNAQLWKLIEKQRAGYTQLMKELERVRGERDAYKSRLQSLGENTDALLKAHRERERKEGKEGSLRSAASHTHLRNGESGGNASNVSDPRQNVHRGNSDDIGEFDSALIVIHERCLLSSCASLCPFIRGLTTCTAPSIPSTIKRCRSSSSYARAPRLSEQSEHLAVDLTAIYQLSISITGIIVEPSRPISFGYKFSCVFLRQPSHTLHGPTTTTLPFTQPCPVWFLTGLQLRQRVFRTAK